jgi:predicted deacylase
VLSRHRFTHAGIGARVIKWRGDFPKGKSPAPTLFKYMQSLLEKLFQSTYQGVDGVVQVRGKRPGPTAAIFAATHGNEIGGVSGILALMRDERLMSGEFAGSLLLVLHNINAYREQLNHPDVKDATYRFLDIDLNRIYDDVILTDLKNSHLREVRRAQKIASLIPQCDAVLDLHSTSSPSQPMLIAFTGQDDERVAESLRVNRHILDILDKVSGRPLLAYAKERGRRGRDTIAIAVECGPHFEESTHVFAQTVARRFLEGLEMIPSSESGVVSPLKYQVIKHLMPEADPFLWAEPWSSFQNVRRGQILATENGRDIAADDDYVLIMPTARPKLGGDGVYLAKRV